ncbi:MAG TPA: GspE/PulE family protein [Patescibacteria group bacterium]|nr:GspE/PulE family protein [Patescibacteria group bacterium]
MPATAQKGVEDVLKDQGKITADQYSLIKLESINTGRAVEDILLEHKYATRDDVMQARSQLLGIPFIDLTGKTISSEILGLVPEAVARRYVLIPFEYDKASNRLSVAMVDPLDLQVVEFLERKSSAKIEPYIASSTDISQAIETQYSQSLTTEVSEALKDSAGTGTMEAEESIKDLSKVEDIIREAPVAKIVSTILEYALKSRASDVHIEALEEKTRVRYRIDGILQERLVLPKKVHESIVSRIKILADLKIDERRLPQDGRFTFKLGEQEVDLRISTLPTTHGEKVVMRLLRKSGGVPTLTDLGLRGNGLKLTEGEITRPHGIFLISGPTGSGKTTTLYSILTKINSPKVNIVTLEDPVEYAMAGINQVQINPQAGLTFASGLRSFLRQDPNIIMVGEIRDKETTELAIQAALTGHLVFSTVHTNNAAGALPRLLDLGAETFLLASSMNAVMAQRVLRTLCKYCKEQYDAPEPVVKQVKEVLGKLYSSKEGKLKLWKGKGCPKCGDSGYEGRIGIYEVLQVSEKIGRLILERAASHEIEQAAVEAGMVTMIQDGFMKSMEGITTIEEVLRVAEE